MGDPERLRRVNYALNSFFARAAWPMAVKKKRVRDFDVSQPGSFNLVDIMVRDTELKSCILSLEHLLEVNDDEVATLSAGLPPSLLELSLSFEGCVNISNTGLQFLARHLPKDIQVLKLDFLGCRQIDDVGLGAIAKALPSSLKV